MGVFSRSQIAFAKNTIGLVVQSVRIHACHAWGRGFESRPDRSKTIKPALRALLFWTGLDA